MNVRGLFMLVVLGMCLVAVAALSNGAPPAPAPKAKPATVTFQGTSSKGNFEEALKEAIASAMESRTRIADAMVEWKLKEVSGAQGGIAGVNRLTVTIEVKPQ